MAGQNVHAPEGLEPRPRMKPIWYFVGVLLVVVGAVVCGTGLWELIEPPAHKPRLFELHTGAWWGAVIVLGGVILWAANRKKVV